MKRSAVDIASAEPSGSAGPALFGEVRPRQRCPRRFGRTNGAYPLELKVSDERVMSRGFDLQVADRRIRAAILNRFTAFRTPLTQRMGSACLGKGKVQSTRGSCNEAAVKGERTVSNARHWSEAAPDLRHWSERIRGERGSAAPSNRPLK